MCDTLVAKSIATADGVSLFAKNSDRPPNEAQYLEHIPAKTHPSGDRVQCTYIEIPQVEETHAVLLSKPYWMWGAEMGVNEHGLAIGNEAIFSKIPANKKPALLGMDLLRLALERATSPREGVRVIIDLLEQFGQGGKCFQESDMVYHNSFLLANHADAWVLETIDRQWSARQVSETYSISNVLTIETEWDIASPGLASQAQQHGLAKSGKPLNLRQDYSDFLYTTFGNGPGRCSLTGAMLSKASGEINLQTMLSILRHHQSGKPHDGLAGSDVCMHAGFGPIRLSQSTGSMVVYLHPDRPTIFATGTSAPCTGILKPLWVDAPPANSAPIPTNQFDPETLFWSHELLHRTVIENYSERMAEYQQERDQMENAFIQGAMERIHAPMDKRAEFSTECFLQAASALPHWLSKVKNIPERKSLGRSLQNLAWKKFNRDAGMPQL